MRLRRGRSRDGRRGAGSAEQRLHRVSLTAHVVAVLAHPHFEPAHTHVGCEVDTQVGKGSRFTVYLPIPLQLERLP